MLMSLGQRQVAAIPFRKKAGRCEVMLITSRETKRWVIPKGWPMEGRTDYNAAKREAFEEAGIEGRIGKKVIGRYGYVKRLKDGVETQCHVDVYLLKVDNLKRNWPEKSERTRAWFSVAEAAYQVRDPDLEMVILALA